MTAGLRRRAGRCPRGIAALLAAGSLASCEPKEDKFPDQIPDVKVALGTLLRSVSARNPQVLDSISTDLELYGDLVFMLGPDSLAVISRRIQNPVDSAHVIMTVAARDAAGTVAPDTSTLDLFLSKRGDYYWFVGHRLTRTPR
jgi:hypothetical protein